MIKNKLYGPAADIFSYGVMLYRMLCGSKPFKGKVDRDLDKVNTRADTAAECTHTQAHFRAHGCRQASSHALMW